MVQWLKYEEGGRLIWEKDSQSYEFDPVEVWHTFKKMEFINDPQRGAYLYRSLESLPGDQLSLIFETAKERILAEMKLDSIK